jgi:hypothetical protein
MGRKRRFYRATLASIVWDPDNNKPLAHFVRGQFVTEDERTADILLSKGYPEVGLDDENPPMIIPDPVPADTPDVKILPPQMTEESMAAKIKREGILEKDKGPGFTVAKKTADKEKPRRIIRRRDR